MKISHSPHFFLLAPLSLLILVSQAESAPEKDTPQYSRETILKLTSKPGKEKGLFSHFKSEELAIWNQNFWGASLGFDQFTGVGWNTTHAGTLITPEHIVCASHWAASHGVKFYGADGIYLGASLPVKNEEGRIIFVNIKPDVCVMKITPPAPEGAKIYPFPNPKTYQTRLSWGKLPASKKPLLVATDWRNPLPKKTNDPEEKPRWLTTRSAHPVVLFGFSEQNRSMSWRYGRSGDPAIHESYHEIINSGDSSHPIFWLTPHGLVLASHFSGVTGGPDYGHPDIQKEIQKAIEKLGSQRPYRLKLAEVR